MGAGFGNGLAGDWVVLVAALAAAGLFAWALHSTLRMRRAGTPPPLAPAGHAHAKPAQHNVQLQLEQLQLKKRPRQFLMSLATISH